MLIVIDNSETNREKVLEDGWGDGFLWWWWFNNGDGGKVHIGWVLSDERDGERRNDKSNEKDKSKNKIKTIFNKISKY